MAAANGFPFKYYFLYHYKNPKLLIIFVLYLLASTTTVVTVQYCRFPRFASEPDFNFCDLFSPGTKEVARNVP